MTGVRPGAAGSPDASFAGGLVLGGCLLVQGVELVPSADPSAPPSFRLPLSGWGEKRYADIRVLTKALYDRVLAALEARRGAGSNACDAKSLGYQVGTVRRLASASRTANAEVVFGGELSVVFGVGRGGRIEPPSHRGDDGEAVRDFAFLDSGLKERVEAAILAKLKAAP